MGLVDIFENFENKSVLCISPNPPKSSTSYWGIDDFVAQEVDHSKYPWASVPGTLSCPSPLRVRGTNQ